MFPKEEDMQTHSHRRGKGKKSSRAAQRGAFPNDPREGGVEA